MKVERQSYYWEVRGLIRLGPALQQRSIPGSRGVREEIRRITSGSALPSHKPIHNTRRRVKSSHRLVFFFGGGFFFVMPLPLISPTTDHRASPRRATACARPPAHRSGCGRRTAAGRPRAGEAGGCRPRRRRADRWPAAQVKRKQGIMAINNRTPQIARALPRDSRSLV